MFDFLKRGRLIRRGLASRKMRRRRRARSELMRNLENATYVRVFLLALFAAGLAFLVFSGQQPEPTKNYVIALLVLATSPISGFAVGSVTLQVRRRSTLIRAGLYVGLAIWLLSLTFGLIRPINWFYPTANDWGMLGW